MKPKYIELSECNSEEILCENLYDLEGKVIVPRNSAINPYIAERLARCSIKKVPVYPSKEELYKADDNHFNVINKEFILHLKKTINNLAIGVGVNLQEFKGISNILYKEIDRNDFLIKYIDKMKCKDEYTYNHSINVGLYSLLIAKWIGCSEEEIVKVVKAGLLHDIGKSKIPSEILNKKGKLTKEEFDIVKTHTTKGYEMSKSISGIDEDIRQGILCHHEREDGSGYPNGLKGREISFYGEILAIADVYDALTSERVYKEKSTPFDAIEEFRRIGLSSFNEKISNIFFKNIINYYIDSRVMTNNGCVGEIVFIPPNDITNPVLKIDNSYIELSREKSLKIVEIVN